jgi:hypothetical protein
MNGWEFLDRNIGIILIVLLLITYAIVQAPRDDVSMLKASMHDLKKEMQLIKKSVPELSSTTYRRSAQEVFLQSRPPMN